MPHDIKALLAHIKSLEKKVKYFEQHHRCCSLITASPPIGRESDESDGDNDQSTNPGFEIIPYEHQHADISKPRKSNPKWRTAANQLLENVHSSTAWVAWIAKLKSSNVDENASIIKDICGVPSQILSHEQRTPNSQVDGVMASAQAFARATKASQGTAAYVLKLQTFRNLVFVSLCAVLEALGYPIDDINEVMRICVSDSSDTNLKRLRSGASWVNRRIADFDGVLGGYATEWFFEYGLSISQYSLLAANNSQSTGYISAPFFQKKKCPILSDCSQDLPREPEEGSHCTPLSIPAFINVLARDGLKVREVCDALGYSTDTELTTQLCHKYVNLCDCARGELLEPGTRKRKPNLEDVYGTKRQMTTAPDDRSDIDTIISTTGDVAISIGRSRERETELETQLHLQNLGQLDQQRGECERGEHVPISAQPALTRLQNPPGGLGGSSGMDMLVAAAAAREIEGDTQGVVTVDPVLNFDLTSPEMDRSGWTDPTQPTSGGYNLMDFASFNDSYDILTGYDLTILTSFELQDSPSDWLNQQE